MTDCNVQLAFSTDTMFGPLFLGCVIGAALWGAGTLQAYFYYATSTKDRLGLKTLVGVAWLSDTTQQAIVTQAVFYYLIQSYADVSSLNRYTISAVGIFEAIATFLVQGFFVWRIYNLSSRNIYVSGTVSLFVFAKLGVGIITLIRGIHIHEWSRVFVELHSLYVVAYAVTAFTDVTICVLLCWFLAKSKSTSSKLDGLIARLIFYSIVTGASTALCALLTFLLAVLSPKTYIFTAPYFLTSRLYVNSLLASLNARKRLRKGLEMETEMSHGTEYAQQEDDGRNKYPGGPELLSEDSFASLSKAKHSLDVVDMTRT